MIFNFFEQHTFFKIYWCPGEDSNLHALAGAATSRQCGCRYATRAWFLDLPTNYS